MENIGLSLSHSVQLQFMAVEISSITSRPIRRLGSGTTVSHTVTRGDCLPE